MFLETIDWSRPRFARWNLNRLGELNSKQLDAFFDDDAVDFPKFQEDELIRLAESVPCQVELFHSNVCHGVERSWPKRMFGRSKYAHLSAHQKHVLNREMEANAVKLYKKYVNEDHLKERVRSKTWRTLAPYYEARFLRNKFFRIKALADPVSKKTESETKCVTLVPQQKDFLSQSDSAISSSVGSLSDSVIEVETESRIIFQRSTSTSENASSPARSQREEEDLAAAPHIMEHPIDKSNTTLHKSLSKTPQTTPQKTPLSSPAHTQFITPLTSPQMTSTPVQPKTNPSRDELETRQNSSRNARVQNIQLIAWTKSPIGRLTRLTYRRLSRVDTSPDNSPSEPTPPVSRTPTAPKRRASVPARTTASRTIVPSVTATVQKNESLLKISEKQMADTPHRKSLRVMQTNAAKNIEVSVKSTPTRTLSRTWPLRSANTNTPLSIKQTTKGMPFKKRVTFAMEESTINASRYTTRSRQHGSKSQRNRSM